MPHVIQELMLSGRITRKQPEVTGSIITKEAIGIELWAYKEI